MTNRIDPFVATAENIEGRSGDPSKDKGHTSDLQSWYLVGLFMLLYVISILDRYILVLQVGPVSAALRLSDTEIALLHGLGFGVVYTLVGLPLAY